MKSKIDFFGVSVLALISGFLTSLFLRILTGQGLGDWVVQIMVYILRIFWK